MTFLITYNTYSIQLNYNNSITTSYSIDLTDWPIVSDHIRCYCKSNGNNFTIQPYKNNYANTIKLAIILEAPHKNEFDINFNPLLPLNGKSGNIFNKNICNKLSNWFNAHNFKNTIFEIKLFNPIQIQTSLYHYLNNLIPYNQIGSNLWSGLNRNMANDIWKFLFCTCSLNINFVNRVNLYKPNYIINCCTGNCKYKTFGATIIQKEYIKDLKANVRKSLLDSSIISSNNYVEDYHPRKW